MRSLCLALLLVFIPALTWAKTFHCSAGDVACLSASINQANANGEKNTITLDTGIYTLTASDNETNGFNGLPSITGVLTIKGAGADTTILTQANTCLCRLVHVAAT